MCLLSDLNEMPALDEERAAENLRAARGRPGRLLRRARIRKVVHE